MLSAGRWRRGGRRGERRSQRGGAGEEGRRRRVLGVGGNAARQKAGSRARALSVRAGRPGGGRKGGMGRWRPGRGRSWSGRKDDLGRRGTTGERNQAWGGLADWDWWGARASGGERPGPNERDGAGRGQGARPGPGRERGDRARAGRASGWPWGGAGAKRAEARLH
jgi:hypothetical protein